MAVKIPYSYKKELLNILRTQGWEVKKNVASIRIGRDFAKITVTDSQIDDKAQMSFQSTGHGEVSIDASLVGDLVDDMKTIKRILGNLMTLAVEQYTETTKERVNDFLAKAIR